MARTVSYIARNERKYADRRIKQLRKDLKGATHEDKLLTRRAISNIQKLKVETYIKGRNPAARAQAMEGVLKLRQAIRLEKNTAQARQNLITKRELNLASTGKRKTFLGSPELSRAKVKIFYQATRNLWQGVPTNMRNEAILIALGEKSLKKAIQKVLARNQEALDYAGEVLHASKHGIKNFHAHPLWQYAQFIDVQGSPDYLDLVKEVENLDEANLSVDAPNLNINELFRDNLENSQDLNEFYTKFSSALNIELKQNESEITESGHSADEVRADVMELITNAINKAKKRQ